MKKVLGFVLMGILSSNVFAAGQQIAEVKTAFQFLGSDTIIVERYEDPKVSGIACYVSRPKRGGITGALGLAEEKSDASIACRQIGPITFNNALPIQEDAFDKRTNAFFKQLHVVRIVDAASQTLVYFTYTDELFDGSPKSSVTAVPIGRPIPTTK